MGRPVKGKFLGATGVDATPAIPVRADIDGTDFEGYIVKQTGSRSYRVSNDGDTLQGKCVLVNKITGHDAGECSIVGLVDGQAVACQKLTNRLFTDWDNNKYTWTTADDSSESLLILTAV